MTDLPAAGSYHGAVAHVHATGSLYYAHAGQWWELVNKESDGRVGTGTENYNIGSLNSAGIITATTELNSPLIGVGTDVPANPIQVRGTGNTEIQVTSDTGIAGLTVGRESGTSNTNNAEFRYGGGAGAPYSSAQSLDILNYGTGNFNYHISANNPGAVAGDFHWHKGVNSARLMTLTNTGRLGIGVTNPGETLTVAGGTLISTAGSGNTVTINADASVLTDSNTKTLTNKTIDANGTGNSITNIEVADFASGVVDTALASVSGSDDTLASAKAIKSYVDTQVATVPTGDITAVVAGTGLSGGATSGSATLNIDTGTTVDLTTSQALSNKTLTSPVINTGVSGSAILDEDNFASDSDTKLATQQSIKAYVATQVATANELSELTDTNITSAADGALLFYDTGTSKWIDNVVSGDITIADTGVATIAAGAVDNAMLAGSIANNKLANDSVSFGGISLDLGQSDATPAFDLTDATNYPTSSLTGTITNAQLAGSIAAGKLAGSIGDSLLSTITTADKVSAAAVQVDGATDGTGITLATTDKLIVDDAGTNKYICLLYTYPSPRD